MGCREFKICLKLCVLSAMVMLNCGDTRGVIVVGILRACGRTKESWQLVGTVRYFVRARHWDAPA